MLARTPMLFLEVNLLFVRSYIVNLFWQNHVLFWESVVCYDYGCYDHEYLSLPRV